MTRPVSAERNTLGFAGVEAGAMPRRTAAVLLAAMTLSATAWAQRPPKVVAIVPLGPVDQAYLDTAAKALQERLEVEVRFMPPVPLPAEAFYPPRQRYRAEKLLDALEEKGPKDAWKVLGVTRAEISTTKGDVFDWGIAGLGLLSGRTCVLSTFLYEKHSRSKAVLHRRLADITVHEFGHTLGLPHCEAKGCVMADAKGKAISSADSSTGQYCPKCRRQSEWGGAVHRGGSAAADAGQGVPPLEPREQRDGGHQQDLR